MIEAVSTSATSVGLCESKWCNMSDNIFTFAAVRSGYLIKSLLIDFYVFS
jgi:hypothetical protein